MALTPSDFTPPTGHESIAVFAITVGNEQQSGVIGTFWYNSIDGATTGSLSSGSDVILEPEQEVSAIAWDATNDRLALHDTPSEPRLQDTFGEGGIAESCEFHIIREVSGGSNQVGSFRYPQPWTLPSNSIGPNGALFDASGPGHESFAQVADQVQEGDSVIIAITRFHPNAFVPPNGQETLALFGLTVGAGSEIDTGGGTRWYDIRNNAEIGELISGGDVTLVQSQDITSVSWNDSTNRFSLFDAPSTVNLSATFGSDGTAYIGQVHIIREVLDGTNEEGFFSYRGGTNSGSNFIYWG